MILTQKTEKEPISFHISRQEKNKVGKRAVYNEIDCNLTVSLREEKENGEKIIEIKTDKYNQLYKESLYNWANDLAVLKERMLLRYNRQGYIEQILNKDDILYRWSSLKEELAKKYRGKRHYKNLIRNLNSLLTNNELYIKSLRYAFPYDTLFMNIYNKDYEKPQESYFEIPSFFIANLPVKISQELDSMSIDRKKAVIKETGMLDTSKFDQERFDNAIKHLRLDVRARSEVIVRYMKKAEMDIESGWIDRGFSYVSATVPGFIFREEITEIKQLQTTK